VRAFREYLPADHRVHQSREPLHVVAQDEEEPHPDFARHGFADFVVGVAAAASSMVEA
jgi:hypothetical protein